MEFRRVLFRSVARGLRLWLLWNARQQNLIVRIDKIDAPLFRPLILRGIHITSAPANPVTVNVDANQGILSLNLKALVLRERERVISALVIDTLQAETRRPVGGKLLSRSGWSALQKILPGKLSVGRCDLRMEDGPSVFLLRGASLSASEIEAGKFEANEITVVSPWFRQSFVRLRGATNWQGKPSVGGCVIPMEDGPSVFLLRGASLSASEIEAGKFEANEITVVSPWFRQSFAQLRGATNWQGTRLTLAGLSLPARLHL